MATNRYKDTDFEQSWQDGYVVGYLKPYDITLPPSPLVPEQQAVYAEGILEGKIASKGILVLQNIEPETHETWKDIIHIGVEVGELGKGAYEIFVEEAAIAGVLSGSLLFSFVSVAILGQEPTPIFEQEASRIIARIRNELDEKGVIRENQEFFMAACNRTDHLQENHTDLLMKNGWWHGLIYITYEQAMAEATTHDHLEDVRILRFQSATPFTIDVIDPNQ